MGHLQNMKARREIKVKVPYGDSILRRRLGTSLRSDTLRLRPYELIHDYFESDAETKLT
jgi:hypothetical protein